MKNQVVMNIAELRHPEKNVRSHSKKQIEEMKRSIKMFGQFRPVIIDDTNTILCGNGLVTAMNEMGIETVEVLKYDSLTANQKKKLMIADNQIASLGTDNMDVIEEFIKSLDGDLDVPGYDEDTLALLCAESEEVTEQVMNYGVYSPDEVEAVREQGNKPIKPVEQTYNPATEPPQYSMPNREYPPSQPENEEQVQYSTAETQRYVICPHCGEKIYLE